MYINRPLIVATASPNRRAILRDAGLEFNVAEPNADETVQWGETPKHYVRRLAEAKARSITPSSLDHLILTADTCVNLPGCKSGEIVSRKAALRGRLQWLCRWRGQRGPLKIDIEGNILGKPRDEADAGAMLRRLSSVWHEVWGGIALRDDREDSINVQSICTRVKFVKLSEEMIDWYISTGEPFGRAGAYAIQGHGRTLVELVEGCFTNVIGISLPLVFNMLGNVLKD